MTLPIQRLLAVLVLALPMLRPALEHAQDPAGARSEIQVVVVPIHDVIGMTTVALVHRAMRMARSIGASHVVLDIDTPGGRIDAMREIEVILAALRAGGPRAGGGPAGVGPDFGAGGVRTVAFVRRQAFSAGGYLALACDETFMAPGAVIGAITPVEIGPLGVQQIQDSDVRRKMLSAMRSEVRALLERRGNLPEGALKLAEAMVDPTMRVFEVTYVEGGGLEVTTIVDADGLQSLEARDARILRQREVGGKPPLSLTTDEALHYGFSSGTVDGLSALVREEFLLPPDSVYEMEESWSESAVDWLETMKPLLFVLGFILLLVEVKVPGLIVPGVLGVLLLGLGLFSSYLVGLAEWTEILLFFLGLVAIAVEVFVLPGTIVFGFVGFLCVVFALVLSQQTFIFPANQTQQDILVTNLTNLLFLVLLVIAGVVVFYRIMPKLPFFNRALLQPPEGARTGESTRFARPGLPDRTRLLGVVGLAATDLRPAGILEHGGERFDVVTTGSFVERGRPVRVIEIEGNRIVVEAEDAGGPPPSAGSAPAAGTESGATSLGLLFLLIVIGLGLVVAEVFFVSFGILSVGAAVALVSAVFLAFTQHGQAFGFLFLAMAAIGTPLCIAFALRTLPKTGIGRKLFLSGPRHEDVSKAAEEAGLHGLLHKRGAAISELRPSGYARIDGRRVDVVTRGEMLDKDSPLRVVLVEGNRVVVALDLEAQPEFKPSES